MSRLAASKYADGSYAPRPRGGHKHDDSVEGRLRRWMSSLPIDEQIDIEVDLLTQKLRTATDAAERETITSHIRAWKAYGGKMSTHAQKFTKIVEMLADEVVKPAQMLADLVSKKDQFPVNWYVGEHARIIRYAQGGDAQVRAALAQWANESLADAAKLRVQSEADRPAAERAADIAERQALVASGADVGDLVTQARAMLDADRPRRAALLLDTARQLGPSGFAAAELGPRVEEALDAEDEKRAKAKAIETMVAENSQRFEAARLKALTTSGLGTRPDGGAGTGMVSEVASSNVSRKLGAFLTGGSPAEFNDAGGDA